jgi:hypothetical protein
MNFRWHPEKLIADGPGCGNDHRYRSFLRVDLTSFFVRLLFGTIEKLFRVTRRDLIDHAKLGAIRAVREL